MKTPALLFTPSRLLGTVALTSALLASGCGETPPADSSASGAGAAAAVAGVGGTGAEAGNAGLGAGGASGGTPPTAGSGGTAGNAGASGAAAGMAGGGGSDASGGSAGASGSGAGSAGSAGTAGTDGMVDPPPSLIGDVTFSVPSQTFVGQLDVGMATAVASAEIRYTTDGTVPTAASTLYAGAPLPLTATTQLRAQAFVAGAASGAMSTGLYIARTFEATSDLPIVVIDGYGLGKPLDKEVYFDAAVMVFEPAGGASSLAVLPNIATRAGYHVRGQSSANFPQTPYKVEFWDNANADADYALLGMGSDSDWALIPPYYDRALVRNPFVYELGRELGLQAPATRFAEVYLNFEARPLAETDYQGIYWISETIKNNKVRTNLKQLDETHTMLPEISGGYIFKFDQAAAEEPILECTGSDPISGGFGGPGGGMGGTCFVDLEVVDPEPLNLEQETWLTGYVQELHDTLHLEPIGDYTQFIDVPSFVDYLIVNELTRNVDAYVRSAYYHKDRDGKLTAGPLWDYNFSLAVGGATTIDPAGGFQYDGTRNVNNWYPKLVTDPAFMTLVKARYAELRQGPLATAALDQRITALAAPLANAVVRDYAKWPVASVISQGGFVRGPTVETWEGQVQALRDFVAARLTWMDAQYQ
jgi:hypothetical protein